MSYLRENSELTRETSGKSGYSTAPLASCAPEIDMGDFGTRNIDLSFTLELIVDLEFAFLNITFVRGS